MIAWNDIQSEYESETLGYRERIVALFRKYEGQETDEKVRGKAVKVTVASFARHMGIRQATFYDWVKASGTRNPEPEIVSDPQSDPVQPADTAPTCINDGVPPAEGFVRAATTRFSECLPLLQFLSEDTHAAIAEDLAELEQVIAQIKDQLKVRTK